ncbi:MAG TPA: alpha/beta hydrolase, partial [Acidimicrobiales bacterium]|nr:alpha/beta hydrolase [Acidimicrobiales bacterium]
MTARPFVTGPRAKTADGVEIATYELGGDGPPLLFAHATGFHGRVWLPLATQLRERFRCVAFDARGHGESGKAPGGNYDWNGLSLDAIAVIHELDLKQPRAVGHSCGGAVLLLAEEAAPSTFRSLYCYEPVVPPTDSHSSLRPVPSPDANPMAAAARRRREVFPSRDAAYANYHTKAPFSDFEAEAIHAYVDWGFEDLPDGSVRLRCRGEDEARTYEMALQHEAFLRLHRVACPVTLACGGSKAHFGPEAIGAM